MCIYTSDANISQTCVTTLAIRHMMIGGGTIMQLNDLRAPMSTVISSLADQLSELQRYRAMYGPLPPVSRPVPARGRTHSHSRHTNRHTIIHEVDEDEPEEEITVEEVDDDDAGSDTEHE